MPRLQRQHYQDIERSLSSILVRATEAAALNSLRWLGAAIGTPIGRLRRHARMFD